AVDGGRPVLVATLALRTGAGAGRGSAHRRGDRRLPGVPRGSRRPPPTIPSIPRDRTRHRPLTAHRGAQAGPRPRRLTRSDPLRIPGVRSSGATPPVRPG